MAMVDRTYLLRRWFHIAVTFVLAFVLIELLDLKFLIANQLYQLGGIQWSLRHHFITEDILHRGVRFANLLVILLLLVITLIKSFPSFRGDNHRRYILLLLSVLLSFGLINYLKAIFGMDCPWDLRLYGGSRPYIELWEFNDTHFSSGRCFPAGHSSIGFAWSALYFFWIKNRPNLARVALALSLALGVTLGFAQQLRGAHFFLDDLTTAFICWTISVFIFYVGKRDEKTNL